MDNLTKKVENITPASEGRKSSRIEESRSKKYEKPPGDKIGKKISSSSEKRLNTPVKPNICQDGGSSEEPPAKKALKDAWIDNNFSGMASDDKEGVVEVYTDGACFNNGKPGAIAGMGVFWGKGNRHNVSERLCGRATNNRAEIHAARRAIEKAKERNIKNLILYTDSKFTINGITDWIKTWKLNGWKVFNGDPVINKDDFVELEDALKGINVKWVHVRGHQGIPGNEAADKLAREGCKKALPVH